MAKCILCDGTDFRNTVFGGYDFASIKYSIVRCINCGFRFLDPMPSMEVLDKIYSNDDYFDNYYSGTDGLSGYTDEMWSNDLCDSKVISLIAEFKKSGKLFDIGCAGGRFLYESKKRGFDVSGCEPNEKMAIYAKDELGLDVICGSLNSKLLLSDKSKFDIIHASDVLEHILDLENEIEIIKRMLKKDGILVLNQPVPYNISIFNLFLAFGMLLKKNRYSCNPPAHLWEFNACTLKKFLDKNRFEILHYDVVEIPTNVLGSNKNPTLKQKIGQFINSISVRISNGSFFKSLNLGNRVFVVCRKI